MPLDLQMALRLLVATGLGAIVGLQREHARKPAGLRTHMLISLGAALFTVISISGFGPPVDYSRVAAGVVTGVGFIGAGAIIHGGEGIVAGLTTAASIWAVAALGVAVGTGMYLISLVATGLIVIILFLPHPVQ